MVNGMVQILTALPQKFTVCLYKFYEYHGKPTGTIVLSLSLFSPLLLALFYIQLSRFDHYMYVYRYHSA